ncbi:MAG: succinate dehydrogenase cytochrome b subunit [Planctomycetes bacterium]|nr:succinate dehydrogenase cytochrome b subunit [Planctomycetota bacterium]
MPPLADQKAMRSAGRAVHKSSSILKKYALAMSGLFLALFLLVHLVGNLTLFIGIEAFDHYAAVLMGNPLLPVAEAVLFLIFAAHMCLAIVISLANRRARDVKYKVTATRGKATFASQSMLLTGLLVGAFTIFHVFHFRVGHLLHASWVPKDDAGLMLSLGEHVKHSLGNPLVALIYAIGVVLVGVHVSHGLWSGCQTLGLMNPNVHGKLYRGSQWYGRLIAVGFLAIVIFVLATQ